PSSSGGGTTRTRISPTSGRTPRRTSSSATAAPSDTGSGGRSARGRKGRGSTASAWRARSGTAGGDLPPTPRTRPGPSGAPAAGGSWPLEEVTGLLEDAQILGKGARGPNPTGMRVLTFGVQVAEVAVDVETGEVRVERVAAIHDVGRIINPLGASSQIEGGIIQAIGHALSEERLDDGTGAVLTQTLDAYRLPTIADVPEIVAELVDIPDEHLKNLGA